MLQRLSTKLWHHPRGWLPTPHGLLGLRPRALRTGYTDKFSVDLTVEDSVDRSEPRNFRAKVRTQEFTGQTSGIVDGFVQANFVALPKEYAFDFLSFCLRNPQPCPLLDVTEPGDPVPRSVAPSADLRTDIPKYCIYRNGKLEEEVTDITKFWKDDTVGFLLGCSFSWEGLLAELGLTPRHVEEGRNVPMFKTSKPNLRSGVFGGNLVTSMRPYKPDQIEQVKKITGAFPASHGAPVHVGNPKELGLADLSNPEWGDAVTINPGEVPVFWACGVTPQTAIQDAALPLVMTHKAGHMFIADIKNEELDVDGVMETHQ